jgi:NAD(P)H-dependent flavin oxidoreductase YrpB (nitropropane dioxygenase family)
MWRNVERPLFTAAMMVIASWSLVQAWQQHGWQGIVGVLALAALGWLVVLWIVKVTIR